MKQINNGYSSSYYLTESGEVYNKECNRYLKAYKGNSYRLKTEQGSYKSISLKELYRLVYNKNYCKDNIQDLQGEIWKEIEGTNGEYYISNLARCKSCKGYEAKIMKATTTRKGYDRLDIYYGNQRQGKFIHRLVAAAFLGQPPSIESQVHHKDFNCRNSAADNLEYLEPSKHRAIHAAKDKGAKENE